jgi:urate oxidase
VTGTSSTTRGGVHLGANQYGKAENRVVRVVRDTPRHEVRDLTVSTSLRGDFTAAHTTGDQADVLPTDTQKNTAFAFAKEKGIGAIEDYALTLADHFLEATPAATGARIEVLEHTWARLEVDGAEHDHAFARAGSDVRTTVVTVDGRGEDRVAQVLSGISDLVVMKTTGSAFRGFLKDRYTTLPETDDRILATSLVTRWRHDPAAVAAPDGGGVDWDASYAEARRVMLEAFATTHSEALQQTLYAMGEAVLAARDEVVEVRFSAPNKHHFLVDLAPFGLENPGEVFIAADRPYGLIEASVVRDGAPEPGNAWVATPGFC